ncbi:phosphoglycerate mutase [Xylariales sp. AK1849]|nr:phosphoglycerate mutase [Xylariales sp. AK1849]
MPPTLEFIHVVRHGFRPAFTVDAATGKYTSAIPSPTGIPTDPPLTSYGVDQANDLASHLLKLDPPIDQVYSSPFYRCLQTISPFVARHNTTSANNESASHVSNPVGPLATLRVENGLSEWFGLAPWAHPASAPLSKLQEFFPEIETDYASQLTPPSNGESLSQLYDRVAAAIGAIITQCDQEGRKAVVVCTHAAVVIVLGRILTGHVPENVAEEDFAAYTCGLSTYRRPRGSIGHGPATLSGKGGQMTLGERVDETVISSTIQMPEVESGMHSPGSVDRHRSDAGGRTLIRKRMDGFGVQDGWICEANSECSFLRGGSERGWKFSGDESFSAIGSDGVTGPVASLHAPASGMDYERPMKDSSKL